MKVSILCVGKLKENYLRDAIAEYAKRLGRYCKFEVVEVAESRNTSRAAKDIELAKQEEAARLLAASRGYVVALDLGGKEVSSEDLAATVQVCQDKGESLCFVIGGSDGLGQEILARANERIRFGRITLPHQLCRVVLAEQIYRAFCINNGVLYHK